MRLFIFFFFSSIFLIHTFSSHCSFFYLLICKFKKIQTTREKSERILMRLDTMYTIVSPSAIITFTDDFYVTYLIFMNKFQGISAFDLNKH